MGYKLLISGLILSIILIISSNGYAQKPILKHSYAFEKGSAKDAIGSADGTVNGGVIQNGIYRSKHQGDFIELPADKIKINNYKSLTLEALIVAGEWNGTHTVLSFFGSRKGDFGTNYILQSVENGGATKTAISCENEVQPWLTESFASTLSLHDGLPHHIVTTFDDETLKFYVDGELITSSSTSDKPANKISSLGNQVAYLCKSGYVGDATWRGAIDAFNIYEGVLSPETIKSNANAFLSNYKPKSDLLSGNWFDVNNGDWKFSCFKNRIIYKNSIWSVEPFNTSKSKGRIQLNNDRESISLFYKIKENKLQIGTNKDSLLVLSKSARYSNVPAPANPPMFEASILNADTAVLKGWIIDYSPGSSPQSTLYMSTENVLTHRMNHLPIWVNNEGYFEVKIPLVHPQFQYVRLPTGYFYTFLEPGKEVTHLISPNQNLAMGANSRLIADFNNPFFSVITYEADMDQPVKNMSPQELKEIHLKYKTSDLNKLEDLYIQNSISEKYYQIMKRDIEYRHAGDILDYDMRIRNNPSGLNSRLPDEPEFYDFLFSELVNDPLGPICPSYDIFINRLEYMPYISQQGISGSLLEDALDKGYDFTATELRNLKTKTAFRAEMKTFWQNVRKPLDSLLRRHTEAYSDFRSEFFDNFNAQETIAFFADRSIELSGREKELIHHVEEFYSSEEHKAYKQATKQLGDLYSGVLGQLGRNAKKEEKLLELGIRTGLFTDIILARDISIYHPALKLISERDLDYLKSGIDETIYDFIFLNEQAKKSLHHSIVGKANLRDLPKADPEELLDEILKIYRGKPVYVMLWQEGCPTCEESIVDQAELRSKYLEEGIVFVNISNWSNEPYSNSNQYESIIGEHYRFDETQWNALESRFNLKRDNGLMKWLGMPRFMLVDKEGEIINNDASAELSSLTPILEELKSE